MLINFNNTIPNTFLITGLGRSGTKFLSSILGRSKKYNVVHEWQLPFYSDSRFENGGKFPIQRFLLSRYPLPKVRRGYGEINSYLRFTLYPHTIGNEKYIEKKAIILRDPKAVITSAMNRGGRTLDEFRGLCLKIMEDFEKLVLILENRSNEFSYFQFELFTTVREKLQEIVDWAGINDVIVSDSDLKVKVNKNDNVWFPSWREWPEESLQIYKECFIELCKRSPLKKYLIESI